MHSSINKHKTQYIIRGDKKITLILNVKNNKIIDEMK